MSKQTNTQPPNASRSDPLPSGLSRALDNTGRVRNSSATPQPQYISPTPRREFSRQVDNMNNPNHSRVGSSNIGGNRSFASPSGSPDPSIRSGEISMSPPHGQESRMGSGNNFVVSQISPTTNSGTNRNASAHQSFGPSDNQQRQLNTRNNAPDLQTMLTDVMNKVERSGGINSSVKEFLVRDIRAINRQHVDGQSRMQQEMERVTGEKQNLLEQLNVNEQSLHQANSDRDRYMKERDDLQQTIDELQNKARSTDERINDLKMRWESTNTALKRQLDVKNEQLDGKRTLWLESNNRSSSRRSGTVNAQDPFASPTPSHTAALERAQMGSISSNKSTPKLNGLIGNSYGQSFALGHANPDSGPPNATAEEVIRPPRRRPNLPTSNGYQGMETPASIMNRLSTHNTIITEPRTEPRNPIVPSTALVMRSNLEDPSEKFQNEFSGIYLMLEGWVSSYAHIPNLANDQAIARSNAELWAFMMNCTYPGNRQDAHTHAMALLNDPAARHWFVMRMGVTHIVNDILSLNTWRRFSPAIDEALTSVRARLLERGLAARARQELVDEQAGIIQSIVSSQLWEGFRTLQLAHHSKKLRDILGPMLNDGAPRAIGGRDLGAITLKAWELAIQLNCTPVTVQVYFPETAAKFSAATMIAKDRPGVDPMSLQLKQTRLKLVITPVVTLRDDRDDKIKARNLHYSTVLTMT